MIAGGVLLVASLGACADAEESAEPTPAAEETTEAGRGHHRGGRRADHRGGSAEPELTPGQENAIESAESYLDLGGFAARASSTSSRPSTARASRRRTLNSPLDYLE